MDQSGGEKASKVDRVKKSRERYDKLRHSYLPDANEGIVSREDKDNNTRVSNGREPESIGKIKTRLT